MSWGNKLLIVFIGFAGLISYMVYRCMQVPVELVAKEYYRDELAYQDVIEGAKKANALSSRISIHQDKNGIQIEFPKEMKEGSVEGKIHFYCASDEKKDRLLAIQLNAEGRQEVDASRLLPGHYTVKISWQKNQVEYYAEQPFIVQ